MLTRRNFLSGATSLSAVGLVNASPLWAAAPGNLILHGPPAGPSIALAHVAARGKLSHHVPQMGFKTWRNPDQLRAGVTSGTMQVTGTPTYVAANMANQGVGVRLLNVMTFGLLYVVSTDETVNGFADLSGKKVVMFYKNDMPDLVFQHVARESGMTIGKDVDLVYVSNPMQAIAMLISGRAQTAVLPEPAATASLFQGLKNSVPVRRAINLQDEWARVTGRAPRIPQAGVLVAEPLLQSKPELIKDLQQAIAGSVTWTTNNPASAGALSADYMGVNAKVIEKSIPWCNLAATTAAEAREELEFFFQTLYGTSPAIIGGRMPEASFYLSA